MKKLLLIVLCVLMPSVLPAASYFLTASHFAPTTAKKHALTRIIQKQPIFFEIFTSTDNNHMLEEKDSPFHVVQAYNSWFKNLNDYIVKQGRTEFAFMQDIIDFGMSDQVAIESHNEEDVMNYGLFIYFLEGSHPYWQKLYLSAAGTFQEQLFGSAIYIRKGNPNTRQQVLVHEIGHSLSIGDSYFMAILQENVPLSSGRQPSIMNGVTPRLTCDDADALANAIYLTMKKNNPSTQDFEFQSFCQNTQGQPFLFRNGKQINHSPASVIKDGIYFFTQFCKNGDVKSVTEINFRSPYPFTNTAQNACESTPFVLQPPAVIASAAPAQWVDLTSSKKNKISFSPNTVIYEYAPLIYREISFNNDIAKTMVKVKTEKGELLYVYAILNQRQAMVFSLPDALLIIYDTQNPRQYTARHDKTLSGMPDTQVLQEIQALWKIFSKENPYIFRNFASQATLEQHMEWALQWQNYIRQNYPNPDIKIKKAKLQKKQQQKLASSIKQTAQQITTSR